MNINISELFDKIIGSYKSYGKTELDDESLKNLDNVRQLLIHIIYVLDQNVRDGYDTSAWSIKEIGQKSKKLLDDIYGVIDNLKYDLKSK